MMKEIVSFLCLLSVSLVSIADAYTQCEWKNGGEEVKIDGIERTVRLVMYIGNEWNETDKYNTSQLRKDASEMGAHLQKYFGSFNLRIVLVDVGFYPEIWPKHDANAYKDVTFLIKIHQNRMPKFKRPVGQVYAIACAKWIKQGYHGWMNWEYSKEWNHNYYRALQLSEVIAQGLGFTYDFHTREKPCGPCSKEPKGVSFNPTPYGGVCRNVYWSNACSGQLLADSLHMFKCILIKTTEIAKTQVPVCGNGILEGEEECDCGPTRFCQDKTCDPWDCTIAINGTSDCAITGKANYDTEVFGYLKNTSTLH